MTRAQDAKIVQMAKALRKARKRIARDRFQIVEDNTMPFGDESTLGVDAKRDVADIDLILKQIDEALA